MDGFLQQFQHLRIQLEEITSATDNFDKRNRIGVGGFGKVYKGKVSSMVAIKRLDSRGGQGIPEFLKEITTLSNFSHENLISLLGFCCEGHEMILVYEYASRGSLDRHLNSPHLTWSLRLKICIDAAKGLSYLHDPRETHQRLIHCDIKSSNILLDDQWNGKVSDFGLSIMGPANEQQSVIVTLAAGTPGYYDPQYAMTHTLTKESDVYSFGVVLFEVLCGRLCCTYSNGRVQQKLVPTWIESYEQNKLNDIIFKNPTIQPLDQSTLKIFSDIAYRCLKGSREDRPKMAEVVTELECALEDQELVESQEFNEWKAQLNYYEGITKTAEPPLNYQSEVELKKLLSRGVLLNGGKTWFLLNENGEHREMVSLVECLDSNPSASENVYYSRFVGGAYNSPDGRFKTCVKTQFLSPGTTYTVNLVFKFINPYQATTVHLISLRYKLQGETKTSISHLAYERKDGWWMCELYQFTPQQSIVDLEILFDGFSTNHHTIIDKNLDMQPISDSDEDLQVTDTKFEELLPTDYETILPTDYEDMTKKEAYVILRKGLLIDDGKKWFSLDGNGKKRHMLSAADICSLYESRSPLSESRFGEAAMLRCQKFSIVAKIQSELVSYGTQYGCYLVYKLPKDHQSGFEEAPVKVERNKKVIFGYPYIYLARPQTPVIRLIAEQKTHNQFNESYIINVSLPKLRNDGWMEVQISEFQTPVNLTGMFTLRSDPFELSNCDGKAFDGLIVEGLEIRPMIGNFLIYF